MLCSRECIAAVSVGTEPACQAWDSDDTVHALNKYGLGSLLGVCCAAQAGHGAHSAGARILAGDSSIWTREGIARTPREKRRYV